MLQPANVATMYATYKGYSVVNDETGDRHIVPTIFEAKRLAVFFANHNSTDSFVRVLSTTPKDSPHPPRVYYRFSKNLSSGKVIESEKS